MQRYVEGLPHYLHLATIFSDSIERLKQFAGVCLSGGA